MKYAIKYYISNPILDKADEIIINYDEKSPELIDFVQKYREDQTIVAKIADFDIDIKDNIDIFKVTYSKHKNFKILMSMNQNFDYFIDAGIPFFFIEGAGTLSQMRNFVDTGVCDIYIVGDLGFDLQNVSEYLKENNVEVRIYPNIAQYNAMDSRVAFFVRPNDLFLYENYVDIIEFAGPLQKQKVLYDIYTDEDWLGSLKDLILNFDLDIDNRDILPSYGLSRLNCKKKCLLDKCNMCHSIYNIAGELAKKELILEKEKK